jgi:hypothetical protein
MSPMHTPDAPTTALPTTAVVGPNMPQSPCPLVSTLSDQAKPRSQLRSVAVQRVKLTVQKYQRPLCLPRSARPCHRLRSITTITALTEYSEIGSSIDEPVSPVHRLLLLLL